MGGLFSSYSGWESAGVLLLSVEDDDGRSSRFSRFSVEGDCDRMEIPEDTWCFSRIGFSCKLLSVELFSLGFSVVGADKAQTVTAQNITT